MKLSPDLGMSIPSVMGPVGHHEMPCKSWPKLSPKEEGQKPQAGVFVQLKLGLGLGLGLTIQFHKNHHWPQQLLTYRTPSKEFNVKISIRHLSSGEMAKLALR